MINIALFMVIFAIIFILSFLAYYYHYDRLARYHSYSLTVDVFVLIGATITIIVAFSYYDLIKRFNYLLWIQLIFAIASLNIHLIRFFIGLSRNKNQ